MDGDGSPALTALLAAWRADRPDRQRRDALDPGDLAALAAAGLLRAPVPTAQGGPWAGPTSFPALAATYRRLAAADPSVALVSAMHPAVLAYWSQTDAPEQALWSAQRDAVLASALDGRRWGTVTSEPGSGGDILQTRTVAEPVADGGIDAAPAGEELPGRRYRLTGDKHFASGFGHCDWMFTTARVAGEDEPAGFFVEVPRQLERHPDRLVVTRPWDGSGMRATQSHAVRLEGAAAVRLAYDGPLAVLAANAGGLIATLFTAVVVGVLDEAVDTARAQLAGRFPTLRAFEQVEWSRAELEHWLTVQAFQGAVRAVVEGDPAEALHAAIRAKTATAELAESSLRRLTQVLGGGTYAQSSPFSRWFEDVRALGFLRPPWGLAYDTLFRTSQVPTGAPPTAGAGAMS